MKFFSLRHTDAPYRHVLGNEDIVGFEVHSQNESIGKVVDVLVDETERSYYVAVERNHLLSQERFILPFTACKLAASEQRIYVTGLDKSQIKKLPTYRSENVTRYGSSHTSTTASTTGVATQIEPLPVEASLPLEYSLPLGTKIAAVDASVYTSVSNPETEATTPQAPVSKSPVVAEVPLPATPAPIETTPVERRFDYVPGEVVKQHDIPLLAERLVVDRRRRKVGEVVVRKVVETQMVSVPVRRERLIVEQVSPERKSLAAIDLDRGELSQDELRRLIPGISDGAIQNVTNSMGVQTASPTETVPIHTAMQILQQVNQASQFKHAAVKLVFNDEDLQKRYERWLTEHK